MNCFGLEYLWQQSEFQLSLDEELDKMEGAEMNEELGDKRMIYRLALSISEDTSTFTSPADSEDKEEEEEQEEVE